MLLNLCGAHGPFFTRNIVMLKDSAGNSGAREVPGCEGIRRSLERAIPLVLGRPIGGCNAILNAVRVSLPGAKTSKQIIGHQTTSAAKARVLLQPHEINLRSDNVITAIEAALLDLLGRHLGVAALQSKNAKPGTRSMKAARALASAVRVGRRPAVGAGPSGVIARTAATKQSPDRSALAGDCRIAAVLAMTPDRKRVPLFIHGGSAAGRCRTRNDRWAP